MPRYCECCETLIQNGLWNNHLNSRAHQHKLLLSQQPKKRHKGDVENQQRTLQETFATLQQIRSKHQDGSVFTKLPAFQVLHERLLNEHSSMYSSFACILNLDFIEFYFNDLKKIVQQCLSAVRHNTPGSLLWSRDAHDHKKAKQYYHGALAYALQQIAKQVYCIHGMIPDRPQVHLAMMRLQRSVEGMKKATATLERLLDAAKSSALEAPLKDRIGTKAVTHNQITNAAPKGVSQGRSNALEAYTTWLHFVSGNEIAATTDAAISAAEDDEDAVRHAIQAVKSEEQFLKTLDTIALFPATAVLQSVAEEVSVQTKRIAYFSRMQGLLLKLSDDMQLLDEATAVHDSLVKQLMEHKHVAKSDQRWGVMQRLMALESDFPESIMLLLDAVPTSILPKFQPFSLCGMPHKTVTCSATTTDFIACIREAAILEHIKHPHIMELKS